MKYAYVFLTLALASAICAAPENVPAPQALQPGTVICDVPREQVRREGAFMVAKEVTGKLTVTIDGKTYIGTLTFPDTKVRRTGVGEMYVDACRATGTLR